MAGGSKTTRDHKVIRQWAEERGGKPVAIRGTGGGDDVGMLRIDFPGYSGGDRFEAISWEEWFRKFDEKRLEFVYQDEKKDGEPSNFFKLVSGETAHSGSKSR